ncbi:armadillo-type protein [Syncephalastrum racemosum]|uniref:V-type proton ATPase subunit H n=1 Tax=Syncephalastrum racemosum TaxID=13706 RepID=A0A1X2H5L0_SYNRA|nr:armadillo-type protein [Syncephalastrum racemosum]
MLATAHEPHLVTDLNQPCDSDVALVTTVDDISPGLLEDVALTAITHPYLDAMTEKIRQESIPWECYSSVGLITADEVAMIRHIENKPAEDIDTAMNEHGIHYAGMFLDLLQKMARVDALQKVLVLIQDMLNGHVERISLFHQASRDRPDYPFGPFQKALRINDEFIGLQASKFLALLICSTPKSDLDMEEFFRWMTFQLQSRNSELIELNVQILDAVFHVPAYRKVFWNTLHAVDTLVNIMKTGSNNPQFVYETVFAIWLLTFDEEVAIHLNRKYDVIPTLIEIAKCAVKEKIIRVVVATFKNFIEKAPRSNLSAMLVSKLLPFVEHLSNRKWADQETVMDLEFIRENLIESFQNLTTFEVYASELETGKLTWSPPHQSDTFWQRYAARLDEDDLHLLRILTRLLYTSDPYVISIACYDLGQYAKFGPPRAKLNMEELGAKHRVMELMTHSDVEVRYQALSATQKYFAMVA